jgi:hypothetical protein
MIKKHLDVHETIKFMEWKYNCQAAYEKRPNEDLSSKDCDEVVNEKSIR